MDNLEAAFAEKRAQQTILEESEKAAEEALASCDPTAEAEFLDGASLQNIAFSVVHVRAQHEDGQTTGTGFVFDVKDCYALVLTARRVFHNENDVGSSFTVCRTARTCYPAELVYFWGRDRVHRDGVDIASVRFSCPDCKALPINDEPHLLRTTEYGFRTFWEYPPAAPVTVLSYPDLDEGIVTRTGRTLGNRLVRTDEPLSEGLIEHDVYLRPGASGAPLLNEARRVIGLNISTADTGVSHARGLDPDTQYIGTR